MLRGSAGVSMFRVEPGSHYLILRRSGLVLTRRAIPVGFAPKDSGKRFKFREHKKWGKTTLAAAVGRVFAYPAGMLRSEPDLALAVIVGLKESRLRLFSTYKGKV
jgi:hypothetical protein